MSGWPRWGNEMKKIFQIKNYHTGEIVKEIDVTGKTESQILKIEMGCLRNLDTENYCCGTIEVKE
jgi:hypothetical protein